MATQRRVAQAAQSADPGPRDIAGLGSDIAADMGPRDIAGLGSDIAADMELAKLHLTIADVRAGTWSMVPKKAHDALNHARTLFVRPDGEIIDMTEEANFDWKAYLACREDFEDVVGPGVVGFQCIRFPWIDPNTNDKRVDFVVLRADGTAVRLHPQSKRNS